MWKHWSKNEISWIWRSRLLRVTTRPLHFRNTKICHKGWNMKIKLWFHKIPIWENRTPLCTMTWKICENQVWSLRLLMKRMHEYRSWKKSLKLNVTMWMIVTIKSMKYMRTSRKSKRRIEDWSRSWVIKVKHSSSWVNSVTNKLLIERIKPKRYKIYNKSWV